MAYSVTTPPGAEPVLVAEMRAMQRLDDDEAEEVISSILAAARGVAEAYLRRKLITQTVAVTFDAFAPVLSLPVGPVQSIASVTYLDPQGVTQTLAANLYRLLGARTPALVVPAYLATWPVTRAEAEAVTVQAVVGYGDAGADVPPPIRQAIHMIAGHLWQNREAVAEMELAEMPLGPRTLLAPYRFWP